MWKQGGHQDSRKGSLLDIQAESPFSHHPYQHWVSNDHGALPGLSFPLGKMKLVMQKGRSFGHCMCLHPLLEASPNFFVSEDSTVGLSRASANIPFCRWGSQDSVRS